MIIKGTPYQDFNIDGVNEVCNKSACNYIRYRHYIGSCPITPSDTDTSLVLFDEIVIEDSCISVTDGDNRLSEKYICDGEIVTSTSWDNDLCDDGDVGLVKTDPVGTSQCVTSVYGDAVTVLECVINDAISNTTDLKDEEDGLVLTTTVTPTEDQNDATTTFNSVSGSGRFNTSNLVLFMMISSILGLLTN